MTVPSTLLAHWYRFVTLVVRRLRLRNPWNYKAPLLIAFTYLTIAVCDVAASTALVGTLAALGTIAGIAGTAYFLNDLSDVRQDLAVGKDNAVAGMSLTQRAMTLTGFLALALLPWTVLPLTRDAALLLGIEFALFVLYSMPPFRLKERGWLGLVADALYAHALPAVLAMITFAAMAPPLPSNANPTLEALLATVFAWQLALGLRNIVLHQLLDHGNDVAGGNRTLAVSLGPTALSAVLARVLVPLEALSFGAFALVAAPQFPWLLPAFGLHAVLATLRLRKLGLPQPRTLREALFVYADNFYADWLPLLFLVVLLNQAPGYWPLAVLHLLVFRNGLRQTWRDLFGSGH